MEPRGTLWQLVNDRCDGRLADRIAALRSEGRTWVDISLAIREEASVPTLSYETVRQWAKMLDLDATADAPKAATA